MGRKLFLWEHMLLLVAACGPSQASSPATVPAATATPSASQRVERVSQAAPELAAIARRLQRLATDAESAGDAALAEELQRLSELTVLSASELLARLDAAEQRLDASRARHGAPREDQQTPGEAASTARPAATTDASIVAEPDNAQPRVVATRRASPRPAQRRQAATPEDGLRERLAQLAERLSTVAPVAGNRVTLESIQAALIEADRALVSSEGIARAVINADEAERLLDSLASRQDSPAPDTTD